MVAKVISGKTIRGVLSYNENKVKAGVATCIMTHLFGAEPKDLNFHEKLTRFQKRIEHNAKTKTNTIHISLNFDTTENLAIEKLCAISTTYMDKIGFGNQPYIVYKHLDAAHPHVHIVTTNIQKNGKRIDIHNLGRNQSEAARKEIEKQFSLVQAESKSKKILVFNPMAERAIYGKSETKRSISNAVRTALSYKFTSLPEFNAVLRQFNVVADRGRESTRMYQKKGLVYSLLDNAGNKIGIPIKASSIYNKPTLTQLESKYALNSKLRIPHKERIKTCIDNCFKNSPVTQAGFNTSLHQEGIFVLLRKSREGKVFGITFVDNKTKVVFNGSDLGKSYTANALLDRIADSPYTTGGSSSGSTTSEPDTGTWIEMNLGVEEVVTDLVTAKQFDFSSPDAAMKRRRKKKKKGRSH